MLENVSLENILFLDIETVPQYKEFSEMDDEFKALWEKKSGYFRQEDQTASDVYQRAGIYAEFGKIACISVGFITWKEDHQMVLRLKTFYNDDETKLLEGFIALVDKSYKSSKHYLCAHNGKEFDFPYIARRILINGLKLPKALDIAGKKPWEVKHLDTLELWKFGDYKHFTSLSLLTKIFGIPTPKDDIDGSMVASVYWNDNDLSRIVKYCEKDVVALAQLFLKYNRLPLVKDENVESVTQFELK